VLVWIHSLIEATIKPIMEKDPTISESTKHRFSSDRPIASHTEDRLGRTDFANSIASSIKGWKDQESLVIALYGAWGSGKSSIKNMVLESLRSAKGDSIPAILEFNPWQWSGEDRVAEAFFREIGLVLGRTDTGETAKKRAERWRVYAATWKAGSFVATGLRKLILILVGIVAATGLANSIPETHWLKGSSTMIGLIALVLLVLNQLYDWIGTLSEKVASVFEVTSQAETLSRAELKEDLSALLRKLKNPVLVVMDDVDRLTAEGIRLLFQLVKANADFPNVIYLLLFQRDIVERSLDSPPAISGREFLEKIVQVGFDIPRLEQARLEKVLFTGLDEFLGDEKVQRHFDQQRWGNLFVGGLRPFFQTLRDVYRYLATLSFHLSLFRGTGSFEVNPIDLIALEVLRVFEQDVYQKLPDAKRELTDLRESSSGNSTIEARMREHVQSLVNQASEPNRPHVQEIIKQLFPPAEWVFGGHGYGSGFEDTWFREQRVCHADVFDRYFHLTIPEGDISQAELDRILSLVGDRANLVSELRSLNERQLLSVALDRLEAYKQTINIQHAVPFLTALFDVGDELPEHRGGVFSSWVSPEVHANRIIYWYLKQEKDIGKRGQILKEAAKASTGLYLPMRTASLEGTEEKRKNNPDAWSVTDVDLEELKQICVQKVEEAAASAELSNHPHLHAILHGWKTWGQPEKPKQWAQKLVESTDGAIAFLTACLFRSTSQGIRDYISEEHWRIHLETVEEYVSIDSLEKVIAGVSPETQPEKGQKAIKAFGKAIRRRQEGKSDNGRWDDDDED
jgi:predicted KAP-like P-loop ATPase